MPLLARVGRRDPKVVFAMGAIVVVLTLGAVTTVYPFLLMLSGSVCNDVDFKEQRIIPRYVRDERVLYQKFLDTKYCGRDKAAMRDVNEAYGTDYIEFTDIPAPAIPSAETELRRIADWNEFLDGLELKYWHANNVGAMYEGVRGETHRLFVAFLCNKYRDDIGQVNQAYKTGYLSFADAVVPFERHALRSWRPPETRQHADWIEFKPSLPARFRFLVTGEDRWRMFLESAHSEIAALNAAYGGKYKGFHEVPLPDRVPADAAHPRRAADWTEFARDKWPLRYIEIDGKPTEDTREQLAALAQVAPERLRLVSGMVRYRDFLAKKYGDAAGVNRAYGTAYAALADARPPYREADALEFAGRKGEILRRFLFQNYTTVLDFILLHGRALWNTLILCLGAVLTHLTVNPLCAYALSRFKLSYGYQILLFCLATMAFPAEVVMIPGFLLLRDMDLLNTYWALILPGVASGYSIFLLKGFFDSLPKELYEAAMIDGASEMSMFVNVTFPMCKPIFAVLALGSFLSAYGGFMWAFVVCSDESMWTIMVYLYQFQRYAPPALTMAALVLVSVPTLLLFIFCQNIIMRGIVIPAFK